MYESVYCTNLSTVTLVLTVLNISLQAREIPGVKIFRCESSLFYINAEHFRTCLYKMTVNPMNIRIAEREHDKRLSRSETEQTLVVCYFSFDFAVCLP